MTEKRYFKKEYDEEYYIFDSTKISEEKVDVESEYGYEVFSNAMTGDEVVDKLNEQYTRMKELKKENDALKGIKKEITYESKEECIYEW